MTQSVFFDYFSSKCFFWDMIDSFYFFFCKKVGSKLCEIATLLYTCIKYLVMKTSFLHRFVLVLVLVLLSSEVVFASVPKEKIDLIIKSSSQSISESPSWEFESDVDDIIDSYSSFIFRTKKSQELNQVKFLINVDSFGQIVGFELLEVDDKGLKERLDYVVRQLPKCKPAHGHTALKAETFEIMIKK